MNDSAVTTSKPTTRAHRISGFLVTVAILLPAASAPVRAIPLLTEIHYNGPASGSDPDEFLELSNPGEQTMDLGGWRFSDGISFTFDPGVTLAPGTSLVIARTPESFRQLFPGFSAALFDYAGALSNGGETLALTNPEGDTAWSIRYDDALPWPVEADGLGASLQLLDATSPALATSWVALAPTPGIWSQQASPDARLPAPRSLLLVAGGLLVARLSRFRGRLGTTAAAAQDNPSQSCP